MALARRLSMDSMNANTQSLGGGANPFPLGAGEAHRSSTPASGTATPRPARQILGFILLVCCLIFLPPRASKGVESYNTVVREHLALESNASIDAPSGDDVKEDPRIADLKRAVASRTETLFQGRRTPLPPPAIQVSMLTAIVLPIIAILVFTLVVYQLKRRFNTLFPNFNRSEEYAKSVVLEDPSVAVFFQELRDGLRATSGEKEPAVAATETSKATEPALPVKELFAYLPDQLAKLRGLCAQVVEATEAKTREGLLLDFLRHARELKDVLRPTELRPAWLLTCAITGLLKQVSKNTPEITDSVIKTLTDGLELLGQLCVRGLNPNLASEPSVRLLAVDDDAVSRLAVSFALRQAFDKPDLANDGEAALAMIAQQKYDVIFLDVDMPSMDGFQLCKQIHQTESHRKTPVVFVTSHNDYQSRIMARLSGGESHIAKPFLTFEITVKALTLVLRSRIAKDVPEVATAEEAAAPSATPADSTTPAIAIAAPEPEATMMDSVEADEEEDLPQISIAPHQDEFISSALIKAAGDNSPQAFATHSPAYVAALRNQLQSARETVEPYDRQKFLTRLLMGLNLLNSEANRVERRMVSRMCVTLERMLKKLLDQNELCGPAMLNAAALALDLIEELATRPGTELDLISRPIRILVVDDDPVARRALSLAIQMAFGRPEQAESGEAALELASKRAFDLIFLDVLMPGMDGFASCVKIHETPCNRQTPAVFVTGKNDSQSLSQATLAGGVGFISKPVLPTQITLTAMTFVLRNRLSASGSTHQN